MRHPPYGQRQCPGRIRGSADGVWYGMVRMWSRAVTWSCSRLLKCPLEYFFLETSALEKIFHVFVSSTYRDLIEERKKVSEAVAKAGYVAEGMEIFPASSQKQMEFIERVIDRCDYYILIIAARYGSTADDGVSYTEKEFQYANAKGIPTLAFIHSNPEARPANMTETDATRVAALADFKAQLQSTSVVDYWKGSDELATKSLAALSQARVTHEGVGWIRADKAAGEDLLQEVNILRKNKVETDKKLADLEAKPILPDLDLADLDEDVTFDCKTTHSRFPDDVRSVTLRWGAILGAIGHGFRTASNTSAFGDKFEDMVREASGASSERRVFVEISVKQQILMQFEALGYMQAREHRLNNGGSAIFHRLTQSGLRAVLIENVVGSDKPKQ